MPVGLFLVFLPVVPPALAILSPLGFVVQDFHNYLWNPDKAKEEEEEECPPSGERWHVSKAWGGMDAITRGSLLRPTGKATPSPFGRGDAPSYTLR